MILTKSCSRGCGDERRVGEIYLCSGMEVGGMPIEEFIHDPVKPYPHPYHRSPEIVEDKHGIYHVKMWIGAIFYPSPWFFIEEVRRFGLSRLVGEHVKVELLTPFLSTIDLIFPYAVPKFDYECYGDGWYWDNCHVQPDWGSTPLGWHHEDPSFEGDDKYYWDFCTFAHRDLSYWFAGDEAVRYDDMTFNVPFPFNTPEFTYDGVVPSIDGVEDLVEFWNKENWLPGVVLTLPFTHIEVPHRVEKEKKINSIVDSGIEVHVTPY